jgi:hypothetical protein
MGTRVRKVFNVKKYTDEQLVLAWYWFNWYPGKGYAESQEKFYREMEQKCIAERANREIERGEWG